MGQYEGLSNTVSKVKKIERMRLQRERQKKTIKKLWADPEFYKRQKLKSAERRAKRKNIEFNLTVEGVVWPTHCPVFGFKLHYFLGDHMTKDACSSLDRIDSTKGYTADNVQVISFLANRMKSNATQEELEKFANWILA